MSREKPFIRRRGGVVVLFALVAGLSCGDSSTAPTRPPPSSPASVRVTPAAAQLTALGDTVRLSAEARDANGRPVAGAAVAWSSNDTSVVTVDAAGLVTAAATGTAVVTARAGAATGEARVSVQQSVDAVVVTPPAATLSVGDTLRLSAEARDANGHPVAVAVFEWSSNDAAVAAVDDGGLVRALAEGMATIAAQSGTVAGVSTITVPDADPERAALNALYRSTGGPGWTNRDGWLSDQPLSEWHGVKTDASGRVTSLSLRDNNLIGALPAELGDLSRLETLNLYANRLTGPLPREIGNATSLRELWLGHNELSGEIPPTLGRLVNLRELIVDASGLSGPIPSELGALTELRYLGVSNNSLSGRVPPELAGLPKLERLFVQGNQLTGAIPSTFTDLEDLKTFNWGRNEGLCAPATASFEAWRRERNTEGPLCDEVDRATLKRLFQAMDGSTWVRSTGWLSDQLLEEWHGIDADSLGRVRVLDLSRNGLEGRVPRLLVDLGHMAVLRLGGNSLAGPIPLVLSSLALEEFRYEDTELCIWPSSRFRAWLEAIPVREGTDEPCPPIADRDILVALYEQTGGADWSRQDNWLSDRPLQGWYGVQLDAAGKVIRLELGTNNLHGGIPPELGQLTSLRTLDVARNQLEGPIPPELGDLKQLQQLHLNFNSLTGSIPLDLGGLPELIQLYLYDNQLEGPIPPELGDLSSLVSLRLSTNRLAGPIPSQIGNLSRVREIWLQENELDGPIPPELGNLHSLAFLYMGFNNLSGRIPSELGSLRSVRELALDGNELTGPIPPALGALPNLDRELNLRLNKLSGRIPAELGNLQRLWRLKLGANRLTGPLPPQLGRMTSLEWLDVAHNAGLAGALPASLRDLPRLSRFETAGTALCLPGGSGDLGWAGFAHLPRCDAATERAYLVQAVQSLAYPVPLIAGEEALLRVFVTAPQSTSEEIPPARATFFANGQEIHSVDVPGQSNPIPTDIAEAEASLKNSANARIPGEVIRPGLEMVVEIDPAGTLDPGLGVSTRIPESGRMAVAVRAMPTFNLTVVPFLWTRGRDSTAAEMAAEMAADPEGHRLLWDTRNLLPVSGLTVHAHEPVLTSSNDSYALLAAVGAVRVMEGETGHYMATLSGEATGDWGLGWIPGWTSYVRLGTGDLAAEALTVAHELGHNMRLWHAPCGTGVVLDPGYPHPDGSTGAWGIDSRSGRDVLVPGTASDLMSYCVPAWVGDYNFSRAMRHRYITEWADRPGPTAPSLLLWGGTEAGGTLYLRPAFAVDAPPALPRSDGPYRIVGRATGGDVLFSLSFEMTPVADGEGRAGFVFGIPYSPEWAGVLDAIELTGPTGSATIDRTTDRPAVILRERSSGRVRGILLDAVSALAAAQGGAGALALSPNLDVIFSRGLPDASGGRR